jgi:hypothetical protein
VAPSSLGLHLLRVKLKAGVTLELNETMTTAERSAPLQHREDRRRRLRLTTAVAGSSPAELDISVQENTLLVTGSISLMPGIPSLAGRGAPAASFHEIPAGGGTQALLTTWHSIVGPAVTTRCADQRRWRAPHLAAW